MKERWVDICYLEMYVLFSVKDWEEIRFVICNKFGEESNISRKVIRYV